MGWKTVNLSVAILLTLFTINQLFNTPFDWYMLIGAVIIVAYAIPDHEVFTIIKITKSHYKNKVNIEEFWKS